MNSALVENFKRKRRSSLSYRLRLPQTTVLCCCQGAYSLFCRVGVDKRNLQVLFKLIISHLHQSAPLALVLVINGYKILRPVYHVIIERCSRSPDSYRFRCILNLCQFINNAPQYSLKSAERNTQF